MRNGAGTKLQVRVASRRVLEHDALGAADVRRDLRRVRAVREFAHVFEGRVGRAVGAAAGERPGDEELVCVARTAERRTGWNLRAADDLHLPIRRRETAGVLQGTRGGRSPASPPPPASARGPASTNPEPPWPPEPPALPPVPAPPAPPVPAVPALPPELPAPPDPPVLEVVDVTTEPPAPPEPDPAPTVEPVPPAPTLNPATEPLPAVVCDPDDVLPVLEDELPDEPEEVDEAPLVAGGSSLDEHAVTSIARAKLKRTLRAVIFGHLSEKGKTRIAQDVAWHPPSRGSYEIGAEVEALLTPAEIREAGNRLSARRRLR